MRKKKTHIYVDRQEGFILRKNKSFMNGLSQLMKDKNALKIDAYKYLFKQLEKSNKKNTK